MTISNYLVREHADLSEVSNAMTATEYYPTEIIPDGRIHRFKLDQADSGKSAWYVVHQNSYRDGSPFFVARWGDWRSGDVRGFQSNRQSLSPEEHQEVQSKINATRAKQAEAQLKQWEDTAKEVQKKWDTLSSAGMSPYLAKKQVPELFGARLQGEMLYVPCRHVNGDLWTFQQIQPNGDKFFFPGGKVQGGMHIIGKVLDEVYVAEGFATAASIHLATQKPVAVAFNAGNLSYVAHALRKKYSGVRLTICGDDDRFTKRGNTGRTKAQECAARIGGRTVFPCFKDLSSQPTDFNDLHCLEGLNVVRTQISKALKENNPSGDTPGNIYGTSAGCMVWNRHTQDGPKPTPLCNFVARITSEETHDDGAERKMVFQIEGSACDGKSFPAAPIASDRYAGMGWINSSWGTRAIVYAGQNTKDHLRVAIQSLSGDVPQRTIYTHLGWRKLSGKWVYLHAGGAIGEFGSDTTVQVGHQDDRLKSYILPISPSGKELQDAIRASLSLLSMAPYRITVPLLAAIYRAPLGEAYGIDFSLFLSGSSGCQKSECSAMAQAHFGKDFNRLHLPGNWATTGNALERQAFLAKDAVFTVDDFAPTGSAMDVARLNKEADRLLRGQGNKAGRGRLTSDAKARPQYFPRGIIISSGEDVPRGPSLRARTLILEMCRGDVNLNCLTAIQSHARQETLAKSMAGYIQWLAPRIESFRLDLPKRHTELREQIKIGSSSHARTPDLVISLGFGIECFLQYALDACAIGSLERDEQWSLCWEALQESGRQQYEFQNGEDATSKFFEMLSTALVSGRAHLADAKTGGPPIEGNRWGWSPEGTVIRSPNGEPEVDRWRPKGDKIGWIDGDEILLNPGAAYASAQEIARRQNDSISTSANTLWKRLVQKGLATKGEPGKNTSKRSIEGSRPRVLVIPDKELLYGLRNGGNRGNGDTTAPTVSSCPQKVPPEFGDLEKRGHKMGAETLARQGTAPTAPIAPISQTVRSQHNLGIVQREITTENNQGSA